MVDDACFTLYNNSKFTYGAQNLKLEDIIDKLNVAVKRPSGFYSLSTGYYPNIIENEIEQTVIKNDLTIVGNEIKQSEQNKFVNGKTESNGLKFKSSCWDNELNENSFKEKIYYELFINDGRKDFPEYILSTRTIFITEKDACYGLRYIKNGYYTQGMLWSSTGWDSSDVSYKFRPVITLNSNVILDYSNSGDGSTPDRAYTIQ